MASLKLKWRVGAVPVELRFALIAVGILGTIAAVNTIKTAQSTEPANPLIGRWQGKLPQDLTIFPTEPLELVFSETDQMLMLAAALDHTLTGTAYRYRVDTKPKPMHLDMIWSSSRPPQTAQTIFEMTQDGKLKLQMDKVADGKPRPQAFEKEMLLDRISEGAIVRLDPEKLAPAEQSKEREGLFVMGSLVRSALVQNLLQNKFATNLAELGLSADTAHYRYELQPQPSGLKVVARPKQEGLKSYAALIARRDDQNGTLASAKLCESVRASRIAPATPNFISASEMFGGIKCASGSEAVAF